MGLKEMVCEGVKWMNLAKNKVQRKALVNAVVYLRVP